MCGYELVVRDRKYLRKGHVLIEQDRSISETIASLFPDISCCGAKLSIPFYQWREEKLIKTIFDRIQEEHIKVLHLSRNYLEQYVSRKRVEFTGVWHESESPPIWMEKSDDDASKLRKNFPPFVGDPNEVTMFCENAFIADRTIRRSASGALFFDYRQIDECIRECLQHINVDINDIQPNAEKGFRTNRLIHRPHKNFLTNYSEIEPIFNFYERQRKSLWETTLGHE